MKHLKKSVPTDEEILAYHKVPVDIAARYLGTSSTTLIYALQDERAPFGFATQKGGKSWTYNISPGLLVNYKRGKYPMYRLKDIEETMTKAIMQRVESQIKLAAYIKESVGQMS